MGKSFDAETIKANMEHVNDQRALLDREPEEIREILSERSQQKLKEEAVLFRKMKAEREYPDNSGEPETRVLWAIEYSSKITCPGCKTAVDTSWESFIRGNRCPLCQQKIELDFYLT